MSHPLKKKKKKTQAPPPPAPGRPRLYSHAPPKASKKQSSNKTGYVPRKPPPKVSNIVKRPARRIKSVTPSSTSSTPKGIKKNSKSSFDITNTQPRHRLSKSQPDSNVISINMEPWSNDENENSDNVSNDDMDDIKTDDDSIDEPLMNINNNSNNIYYNNNNNNNIKVRSARTKKFSMNDIDDMEMPRVPLSSRHYSQHNINRNPIINNDNGSHSQSNIKYKPPPPSVPFGTKGKFKVSNFDDNDDVVVDNLEDCNFESLLDGLNEGSLCLHEFYNALKTYSEKSLQNNRSYLQLFRKSRNKYQNNDYMPNFVFGINLIHNFLEHKIREQMSFNKYIAQTILPILISLDDACKLEHNKTSKLYYDSKDLYSKKHKEYNKLYRETQTAALIAAKDNMRSDNNNDNIYTHYNNNSNNNKSNNKFMNQVKKIGNLGGTLNFGETRQKNSYDQAKSMERQLKNMVNSLNKQRDQFISDGKRAKQDIVNMEHNRISAMLKVFSGIINEHDNTIKNSELKRISTDIQSWMKGMDATTLVQSIVVESIEKHGKFKAPPIKTFNLKTEFRDQFKSLEDAMSITLEINPNSKIPLIVTLLCDKIKSLDGFKTEGIFRKSPSKIELNKYKKRIQNKNWNFDNNNVHIYAVLLKTWLRELNDCVIPMKYYPYCIDMTKEKKLNKEQFEVLLSQLPAVNRELIKYIIKFLNELLNYKNITKMNLQNIAIVFGPAFLRNPSNDAQNQLNNARYEKEFVEALVTKLL